MVVAVIGNVVRLFRELAGLGLLVIEDCCRDGPHVSYNGREYSDANVRGRRRSAHDLMDLYREIDAQCDRSCRAAKYGMSA